MHHNFRRKVIKSCDRFRDGEVSVLMITATAKPSAGAVLIELHWPRAPPYFISRKCKWNFSIAVHCPCYNPCANDTCCLESCGFLAGWSPDSCHPSGFFLSLGSCLNSSFLYLSSLIWSKDLPSVSTGPKCSFVKKTCIWSKLRSKQSIIYHQRMGLTTAFKFTGLPRVNQIAESPLYLRQYKIVAYVYVNVPLDIIQMQHTIYAKKKKQNRKNSRKKNSL